MTKPITVVVSFFSPRASVVFRVAAVLILALVVPYTAEAARTPDGWRVDPGESLYLIARRVAPDDAAARPDLMRRILALNPSAFVGGDPNRLLAGVILKLPEDSADRLAQGTTPPMANDDVRQAAAQLADQAATQPAQLRRIGTVRFARGAVTAQYADQPVRVVGRGSELYERDVLNTGERSLAVLNFDDGSRITLRPDSIFQVEQYRSAAATADESPSGALRLFQGGMRTLTGAISKGERSRFYLRTPMATIGIRGTEFDARICRGDCAQEAAGSAESPFQPAGRVAFVRGQAAASGGGKAARALDRGSPVYAGETIDTGQQSFAVIALRDGGRVTLRPNTRFQIEQFLFKEGAAEQGNVVMRLFSGGMRAVTGLIGKTRRENYLVNTPVATIGIRGTGYDAQCRGSCASLDAAVTDPEGQDGAFFQVFQPPGIDVIQGQTVTPVDIDQTVFIASPTLPPVFVQGIPADLISDEAPRPDQLEIDEQELEQAEQAKDGLQLALYDGDLDVETSAGDDVGLTAGDALFVGEQGQEFEPVTHQRVLLEDPYLSAGDLDLDSLNNFDLIPGAGLIRTGPLQCGI